MILDPKNVERFSWLHRTATLFVNPMTEQEGSVVVAGRLKAVLGAISELGDISSRPLFGGHGLFWRDVIFGILFRGRLFLEVDEESKGEYLSRGMGPFRPGDRQTLKSYYKVPPEILEDPEALLSWAGQAIRVGQESMRPV